MSIFSHRSSTPDVPADGESAAVASKPTLLGKRVEAIAWWFCFGVCALTLASHFFLIELSNLPQNFVALELRRPLGLYMQPLFSQNWNFFAPTPVSDDITVVARVRNCAGRGPCHESSWYAVSTPLLDSIKRNRLSSLGVVQIMLDNAAIEYRNSALASNVAYVISHGKRQRLLAELPFRVNPVSAEVMVRTCAAAIRIREPDTHFDGIQVALYIYEFPRFSRRDEPDRPDRDGTLIPMEWRPFPNDIAPFAT